MIELPIPLVALADCGAILGRRGAGKSGTGRALLEHELDAGHRCCVIDPKGDWYGIRLNKDGTPSRFEIPVFGGAHADVPITDDMGAVLGQIVATSATSCVIDLSTFSRAGMLRFMAAFAEALFMNNRQPLTLLVDEADQLAPQKVPIEVAKVLHFMESLIRQGRQRGIFMWMLTQRPAVINKNLLSQAETLIAMQMTGPQDRKAIRDWMDAHDPEKAAEVSKDLAKLTVGQAWAWVPGADFLQRVQFPLFETYDSGRTPKHGEAVNDVVLPKLTSTEFAALLKAEDSEEEVDELAEARAELSRQARRNSELTRENQLLKRERDAVIELMTDVQNRIGAAIGSPRIEPIAAGVAFESVLMVLDDDGVVRAIDPPTVTASRVRNGVRQMRSAVEAADKKAAALAAEKAPLKLEGLMTPEEAQLRGGHAVAQHITDDRVRYLVGYAPAQHRILNAIAAADGRVLSRSEIARLAGVSITSSNMGVKLDRMVSSGIIEQEAEGFRFTKEGTPKL